jgi:hypothetical protein
VYRGLAVAALLGGVSLSGSALLPQQSMKTKPPTAAQNCEDRFSDIYAKCLKEKPQRR